MGRIRKEQRSWQIWRGWLWSNSGEAGHDLFYISPTVTGCGYSPGSARRRSRKACPKHSGLKLTPTEFFFSRISDPTTTGTHLFAHLARSGHGHKLPWITLRQPRAHLHDMEAVAPHLWDRELTDLPGSWHPTSSPPSRAAREPPFFRRGSERGQLILIDLTLSSWLERGESRADRSRLDSARQRARPDRRPTAAAGGGTRRSHGAYAAGAALPRNHHLSPLFAGLSRPLAVARARLPTQRRQRR